MTNMGESPIRVSYTPDVAVRPGKGAKEGRGIRRLPRTVGRMAVWIVVAVAALLLPFVVLVRVSILVYERYGVSSWPALAIGSTATLVLLLFYVLVMRVRFQRTASVPPSVRRGLAAVVGGYVVFTLIYLSGANAKTPEIRQAYTSLNPLLRVATSTVLLMDREAIVTDLGRSREDYLGWGLPVNEASLHFEQTNGFVHAVDLRTRGRPAWRSWVLEIYFLGMGFRTLRHVGTADHLHVSLPTP